MRSESSAHPSDTDALVAQIGRPLRAASKVVARCPLHLPVVVQVPPVLDSGEPFPTLYWLSCPLAHKRIARLEAAGGVQTADARVEREPAFASALEAAHRRYADKRDALAPVYAPRRPSGGVGGSDASVKCLHAHFADHAAGHNNPVGQSIVEDVLPLNCTEPCVVPSDHGAKRNPAWSEPRAAS